MSDEKKQGMLDFSRLYVKGSDTSKAAAKLAKESTTASDESRVLAYITRMGSHGATDDEVEVALNMSHQNASARRRGLVLKDRVRDSGNRRKTRTGSAATVWVLA